MLYAVSNFKVELGDNESDVTTHLAEYLGITAEQLISAICVRRAIDARKKSHIHFVCTYEVELSVSLHSLPAQVREVHNSSLEPIRPEIFKQQHSGNTHVVIIGAGPAGLFAALSLAESGFRVTLLERGKPVETRMRDIGRLRSRGELDPESNICFGEGGAGTYTDGKLYTRIKHPFLRWVLHCFVRFGAKPDILIDAHPHLGTDKLVRIVRNIRNHLISLGVDYRFETRVNDLLISNDQVTGVRTACGDEIIADKVILATGHSARDTFERLHELGIAMEAKSFAVGVRAEHPQELINQSQYGRVAHNTGLEAAEYKLTHQVPDHYLNRRGVYSFCMCPGGLIVPSPTEQGRMAVNGMSNAKRGGRWANSGIVVQVTSDDVQRHGHDSNPLMGIAFQRELEEATFKAAGNRYAAPAMRLVDFIGKRPTGKLADTRFKPEAVASDLWQLFPDWLAEPLAEGIKGFGHKMRGFVSTEANLLGSETRTSSPVRVMRDEQMQSISLKGLYPVGEGAGYAGGIVSAAVDGLKAAAAIIEQHHSHK
ncbi:D-amino acid dehydrogenase small subunit [Mariprofundus micogutta]|uniref:D-amino acid dehydrogenase small subunit n=1 Tax=Mariprofundus micogutta TaxID=1921010 RepID=A0A1L8CKU9_9PROT|nr:FAD-dependent oxidoreductase [Mariprofundus micogutta]GAV19515.1 D-amino acid dehydrogenase small subunit [Mariprofundus micogutta]